MDSSREVGLVTVTYNSSEVIDEFMNSVLDQTYKNFVLYIIDNNSSDDTLQKLNEYDNYNSRIRLIKNNKNLGVAEGNNQGINECIQQKHDYTLLINNDTVFDSLLIESLVIQANSGNTIVVPKIMYYDIPEKIWFAGGRFTYTSLRGLFFGGLTHHDGVDQNIDDPKYNQVRFIEYASTCCMLIETIVFSKTGLMDERYFVYYDDTDFCARLKKLNFNILFVPSIKMYHKVSSLTKGFKSDFSIYYYTRNTVFFIRKNISILQGYIMILFFEIGLLIRFILMKDSLKVFLLKQKAFNDGLRIKID
jgi:GT2 family glycosyltransferase